jgi:hypothetical protein
VAAMKFALLMPPWLWRIIYSQLPRPLSKARINGTNEIPGFSNSSQGAELASLRLRGEVASALFRRLLRLRTGWFVEHRIDIGKIGDHQVVRVVVIVESQRR